MSNEALTSLAILKTNWDQNKDYIENFVPFVAHALSQRPASAISLSDLQRSMRESLGLNVPQNSLKIILGRAKKPSYGYVRQDHGVYFPVQQRLQNLKFGAVRQRVLREHRALLEKLRRFCKTGYHVDWGMEDAENALLRYLTDYDVEVLSAAVEGHSVLKAGRSPKSAKFLVNAFVRDLTENDQQGFEYLETVVKGNMLANALFLSEPGMLKRKFNNTDFYLDTPLVLRLLGWEGPQQQDPAKELVDLLYQEQANLKVFQHTFMEIHGILDVCEQILRNPSSKNPAGATVQYLAQAGHTASDVQLLKARLEESLGFHRIQIVEKPPYDQQCPLDEAVLEEHLQENVGYRRPPTLIRDVDSLSAVFRLRRGRVSEFVDSCRAVFVTTNASLARASRSFFCSVTPSGTAPVCVTDYILTNLVWLKNPVKASDLPSRQVIANSYAALEPNEELWLKYLTEISKLREKNRITPDDYYLLRMSIDAKKALMDLTQGEVVDITEGDLQSILHSVKSRIVTEKEEELRAEKEGHAKTQKQLDAKHQADSERRIRLASFSTKVASILSKVLFYVLLLLLAAGAYLAFPTGSALRLSNSYLYVPSLLMALSVLVAFLNQCFGYTVKSSVRKLEVVLRDTMIRKLNRVFNL